MCAELLVVCVVGECEENIAQNIGCCVAVISSAVSDLGVICACNRLVTRRPTDRHVDKARVLYIGFYLECVGIAT